MFCSIAYALRAICAVFRRHDRPCAETVDMLRYFIAIGCNNDHVNAICLFTLPVHTLDKCHSRNDMQWFSR